MFSVRQGDVLLVRVDEIPADARPVPAVDGRVILAFGEATGHHHSIRTGATLFRPDDMPAGPGGWLSVADGGAVLEHQEHASVAIPPGLYRQAAQVEETPKATRIVAD